MGIGQFAQALVPGALGILGLGTLSSDTPRMQAAPYRVVFLGRASASTDNAYRLFMDAIRQAQLDLNRPLNVEFVAASDASAKFDEAVVRAAASSRPDLLVAPNGSAAQLASRFAANVPMIFSSYLDPVQSRIASSMHRRSEAITGIWVSDHLDAKRMEVLLDAYPQIRRIAILGDRWWADAVNARDELPKRARALGIEADVFVMDKTVEVHRLFDQAEARAYDAWCIPRTFVAQQNTALIHAHLRSWRKPAVFATTADVTQEGAPLAYALDTGLISPALASLAVRVLSGEPASSIPVQRPQRFVLAVHAKPAGGVAPPSISVLRRADVVVR